MCRGGAGINFKYENARAVFVIGIPFPPMAGVDIYGVREELMGELNCPVRRWLNKVLTVHSTVTVKSWRENWLNNKDAKVNLKKAYNDARSQLNQQRDRGVTRGQLGVTPGVTSGGASSTASAPLLGGGAWYKLQAFRAYNQVL
eukprot:291092-Prorocentrum_minimum.AAC.1